MKSLAMKFPKPVLILGAAAMLLVGSGIPTVAAAGLTDLAARARITETYGKSPLGFEIAPDQAGHQASFLSRGNGYTILLSPAEARLILPSRPPASAKNPKSGLLRMNITAANPNSKAIAAEMLPGKVNYFIGNCPEKWRTSIPTFARVKYEGIYRGVDLIYYGNNRQLEFDFNVGPGANPEIIRLNFEGADELSLDAQGNLLVKTLFGQVIQFKPLIYQEVDGIRKNIDGGYVLRNQNEVGFQVAAYDHSKALVIDPTLAYATYLGGSGADYAYAVAVDAAGDAYIAGQTSSTDFPTTSGACQTNNAISSADSVDGFVTKLSPAGVPIYSTYLGGTNYGSGAAGIALDPDGNAYVTGSTGASDFPATPGAFQTNYSGFGQDAFVAKLNATGSALLYSTFLGGNAQDDGTAIAVDGARNAIVTGRTASTNFPTYNAFQPHFGGGTNFGDAFVTKINASGSALIYSSYLGGSGDEGWTYDTPTGLIAVDNAGNAYVTGSTSSTNFPTRNAFQPFNGDGGNTTQSIYNQIDAFLTKISPTGALIYSTYLGGAGEEFGYGVNVDSQGDAYVVGSSTSCDFPFQKQAVSGAGAGGAFIGGAYIAKFNPSGSQLLYSTFLGGQGAANAVAVDAAGHAFVTGRMTSDFQTYRAVYTNWDGGLSTGTSDPFVAELAPDGGSFVYATYLSGSAESQGFGIGIDAADNAYVVGYTGSTNFLTTNAFQPTFHGGPTNESFDAFAAKITPSPGCLSNSPPFGMWQSCAPNPPTLDCPPDVTVAADANKCTASNVALGSPMVSSGCGDVKITNTAPAIFPVGQTLVIWKATASCGTTICAQNVTVLKSVKVRFLPSLCKDDDDERNPSDPDTYSIVIHRGQIVKHMVRLVGCDGQPVTNGVTVKLEVQGLTKTPGGLSVFQDVIEVASRGVGISGTAGSEGLLVPVGDRWQFDLDTQDFTDPHTLYEPNRFYRSTVSVWVGSVQVGQRYVNLETRP